MKIKVNFFAGDISLDTDELNMDLATGSTVDTLLDECLKMDGISHLGEGFKGSMVLVNNGRATLDTELKDGDKIRILRIMNGG